MKKILSLILFIAIAFSLSACGKNDNTDKAAEQKTLMGWLKSGESVECTLEAPTGTMKMFAKGESVLIEGVPYFGLQNVGDENIDEQNNSGFSLTSGDWMYMWDQEKLEGMKFNLKEMEELGAELGEEEAEQQTWEDQVGAWEEEGVTYDCKKTNLPDELFEEPKDVEFTDMAEMMRGFADFGKNMQMQMEEGGAFDPEKMEELKDLLPEGSEMPDMPQEQEFNIQIE